MFLLSRMFFIGVFFVVLGANASYAAIVPVSTPLSPPIPATCDADFWDVLKNRAWQEGQREITQNQNLIAQPDSVLSMVCFDYFAGNFARYGSGNFPRGPQDSLGRKGGFIAKAIIAAGGNTGHSITKAIEWLVTDHLITHIHNNFAPLMIGDRAISVLTYAAIPSSLSNVGGAAYNGCQRMNDVWQRTKCYDMASEKSHDWFFDLKTYSTASDYRTKVKQCPAPTVPTWSAAYAGGNSEAGGAGGIDPLVLYLTLRDSTKCSSLTPIKTGYIVSVTAGNKYIDAVCPAPGCYFNPPASITGTGSCQ